MSSAYSKDILQSTRDSESGRARSYIQREVGARGAVGTCSVKNAVYRA